MSRAFLLVMDSVGIGGAPDAAHYDDLGADTVGHIAIACANAAARRERAQPLHLPQLVAMGLGEACRMASGHVPPGLEGRPDPQASFGCAAELSMGKDTPSGHWELAGLVVPFDWGRFADTVPCFPPELVDAFCSVADLPGILGDCHASGTEIIAELGAEHMRTGKPICYTSADSVFQIAAHEESFGLERLYEVCSIAKPLTEKFDIARVIARPFAGDPERGFVRTGNRRDFMTPPVGTTLLDWACGNDRDIVTVGKIHDIFAGVSTGRVLTAHGNDALFDRTMEGLATLADGGLLFANFIDFDTLYGHRRDVEGYACALEQFDARLGEFVASMRSGDLLVVTADHGCDPTWSGCDHPRELVRVLMRGVVPARRLGRMSSFACVAHAIGTHLGLPDGGTNTSVGVDHKPRILTYVN
jgi:phosphopentomutase